MGKRSPILGYNHNIRHRGLVFHVQTEDSGVDNPHIFTHLFRGGVIVSSRRLDYDAEAGADVVKSLMQAQHKAVLKELRRGAFADKIASYFADDPDLDSQPENGSEHGDEEVAAAGESALPDPEPEPPTPAVPAEVAAEATRPDPQPEPAAPAETTWPDLQLEPAVPAEITPELTEPDSPPLAQSARPDTAPDPPTAAPSAPAARARSAARRGTARFATEVSPEREVLSLADEVLSLADEPPRPTTAPAAATPPQGDSPAPRDSDAELSAAFDSMRGAEPTEEPPVRVTWSRPTRRAAHARKPPRPAGPARPDGASAAPRAPRAEEPPKGSDPSTIRQRRTERGSAPTISAPRRARQQPRPSPAPSKRAPAPPVPSRESKSGRRHTPGGVVVSRPAVIIGSERRRIAAERPAAAARERSRVAREEGTAETVFGGDLISEKSLDEVILAYLSEDGSEE